jgi:hypothetical protein
MACRDEAPPKNRHQLEEFTAPALAMTSIAIESEPLRPKQISISSVLLPSSHAREKVAAPFIFWPAPCFRHLAHACPTVIAQTSGPDPDNRRK